MTKLKQFWDNLMEILPILWGVLWALIITFGSVALLWQIIRWLFVLGGVL